MYVVEERRLPEARGLGKADVTGNDGGEDLGTEKAAKVGCNLARQRSSLVVHCEEDSFDREGRIEGPSHAHKGI